MTGTVTINGVTYNVGISDLTPADVLPVFRTDTSILKTDSILLSSANSSVESPASSQNSAKKVLIPHLISLMTSAVAEDAALTIEPYYNDSGLYQGMYWHYNGQWLRRTDTGEMIRVDDSAAEIALAAEQAVEATIAAKEATTAVTNTETRVSAAEEARVQAENQRKSNEQQRQNQEQTRQNQESTRQQNEATRQSQEQTRQDQEGARAAAEQQRTSTFADDHQTAGQDHTRADDDHQTAGQDHTRADDDHQTATQDHTRADDDHANALNATAGAEKVDAELDGMTVTITDRNGTSKSVDLSFDFYETYASVAAMNADLANIPKCAMVSIATDDPLDDENARVYQKRSDGTMKYICDLDQKSAEAWNDWLENKKPEIQQRIDTADADHQTATQDHTRADDDHQTATQDHTRADDDHQTATQDHTRADDDHQTAGQDHTRAEDMHAHPPYIADGTTAHPGDIGYFYSWNYTGQQYVRGPKLSLDFTSLTTAQYNQLVEDMKAYVTAPYGVFVGETLAFTGGAMHVGETLVVSERGEFSGEMLVLS